VEPISYLQAIVLGLLQGIAEPFPISSLGHGVIAPSWRRRSSAPPVC
jgi:undecaprenyl-diphosphatase